VCANGKVVSSDSRINTPGVCKYELYYEVNDKKLYAVGFKDKSNSVTNRNLEWYNLTYTKLLNYIIENNMLQTDYN